MVDFCYNTIMEWLAKLDKNQLTALERPVPSSETTEYRRRMGLSRWSVGVDMSQTDTIILVVLWMLFCGVLAVAMSLAPHWLVMTAMLLVLAVVSGVLFFQASERAIRRHVRMSDFAARCGLQYSPLGKTNAIGTGLLFDVGHSRRYRGVLSYEAGDRRLLEIGRYEYTIGRGKHQQAYTWRYMAVRLPRRVPHMVLDATRNDAKLMSKGIWSNLPVMLRGSQRISLEGDFNNHFTLYAPKNYDVDARYVLTPDVMAALVDVSSIFDVELVDDMAFFYTPLNESSDVQAMRDMLTVLEVVGRELHDQTDGYADDRVADARQTNAVAEQGRRLKKWKVPGV